MKKFIVFGGILSVLLAIILIPILLSFPKWKDGLYFEDQDTLYSVKGRTVYFELAGYYVGNTDPEKAFEEGSVSAALINENRETQLSVLDVYTIKNAHYYDVMLCMTCELDEANSHYNEIRIRSDVIDGFEGVAKGDFRFQSFEPDAADDVTAYMYTCRMSSFWDSMLTIENTGKEDILIIGIKDEFQVMTEDIQRIPPEADTNGIADFLAVRPAQLPMIVRPNETVTLYYEEEVDKSDGYIYYQPAFAASIGGEYCILCFDQRSNYPFILADAETVLTIIKEA